MTPKQFNSLIQIRERLLTQLMMVSRLIDYYLAHCVGKPTILLEEKEDEEDGGNTEHRTPDPEL